MRCSPRSESVSGPFRAGENGIPFAGMGTPLGLPARERHSVCWDEDGSSAIPASQIPFSNEAFDRGLHPSKRNTILKRGNVGPARPKLCLRRHRAGQTVPPATRRASDCASDDNLDPFGAALCRQVHSLAFSLSPEAQSGPRGDARVCLALNARPKRDGTNASDNRSWSQPGPQAQG